MRKFLPSSLPLGVNSKGLTLVELLIVIVILAILSLIGFGVFAGAQGGARDGRRRVEIDQLAKNIESTRDPITGVYFYNTVKGAADYPNGLPEPKPGNVYCHSVATTSDPPVDPANFPTGCPTDWAAIGGSPFTVGINTAAGTNDLADPNVKGWKVCGGSERTTTPICKGNILR